MACQAHIFYCRVEIIVVVVNTNKNVAPLEQTQGEGRTDEACEASYEDFHQFKIEI